MWCGPRVGHGRTDRADTSLPSVPTLHYDDVFSPRTAFLGPSGFSGCALEDSILPAPGCLVSEAGFTWPEMWHLHTDGQTWDMRVSRLLPSPGLMEVVGENGPHGLRLLWREGAEWT